MWKKAKWIGLAVIWASSIGLGIFLYALVHNLSSDNTRLEQCPSQGELTIMALEMDFARQVHLAYVETDNDLAWNTRWANNYIMLHDLLDSFSKVCNLEMSSPGFMPWRGPGL